MSFFFILLFGYVHISLIYVRIRPNFCFIFHDFIGTRYFSGDFSFSFVYTLGFGILIYISEGYF